MDGAALEDLLEPFPVLSLGWFCLGYNLSDAPGRADSIRALLLRAGVTTVDVATLDNVNRVLQRVVANAPRAITLQVSPVALVSPLQIQGAGESSALTSYAAPWAPYAGGCSCTCGRRLVRWRSAPAVFSPWHVVC
jgi:hypothetical protein